MAAQCDPLTFYEAETEHLNQETEDFIKNVIFSIVCTFLVITTPSLIVLPFISSQLNTITRKVIAMIVLCDFCVAVLSLIMVMSNIFSGGQQATFSCWVVAILFNFFLTCSLVWTCMLLLNICINSADHKTSFNSPKVFRIYHVICWTVGALINIPNYMHYPSYSVTYRPNYLFEVGCHLNFTFIVKSSENGTAENCLIDSEGATAIAVFYSAWAVIIILTWVLFALAVKRAHNNWTNNRELARRHYNSREGNIRYIIATEAAKNTYLSCFKFMVPGVIYSIAFVPVIIKELYGINNGEIKSVYLKTAYALWYASFGVFVALLNFVFYGIGSSTFREELKLLFHQLTHEVRSRSRAKAKISCALYNDRNAPSGNYRFSSVNDNRDVSGLCCDVTRFEMNY